MTGIKRYGREELPENLRGTWDWLQALTGQAAYVEAFAGAPELLDFTMKDFYDGIFYKGTSRRYQQLAATVSLGHGCRSCSLGKRRCEKPATAPRNSRRSRVIAASSLTPSGQCSSSPTRC